VERRLLWLRVASVLRKAVCLTIAIRLLEAKNLSILGLHLKGLLRKLYASIASQNDAVSRMALLRSQLGISEG